ncbi:MAG: hybrid sensor histidine kinase/response regulator [Anaerolineae bacterium]|nr:hybrid sensor histidine kinase/response regulator [Anaerolineae bacterium]
MSISASVRERLLNSFRAELKDHIQVMTDGLLTLEQQAVAGPERTAILDKVFRAAHSLKGAARSVGVTMIEQLAHALENILDALRKGKITASSALFTICYQAFDAIQTVQAAYESGATTPPPAVVRTLLDLQQFPAMLDSADVSVPEIPGEPPAGAAPVEALPEAQGVEDMLMHGGTTGDALDETIRVKVEKLDALMAQLSELMVTKIRAEQRLAELRRIESDVSLWQKDWLSMRSVYSQLLRQNNGKGNGEGYRDKDVHQLLLYLGENQNQLRETSVRIGALSREYASDAMHMSLVIDELEEEIKRVRMLPLSVITGTFGRMVRDLAQEAGKEAVLRIVGAETELDKRVLEQIKDPLVHLLRNAVDHGIETPDKRLAANKHRQGTVTLHAEQMGNDVVITVSDDGAGLNMEDIRQAVARHAPSRREAEETQSLTDAELKLAIFAVGISTSPVITDISGRGVGLDVVRRNVEALHGRIDVESEPGCGARFVLTLPMTLSSSRGLLVMASGERLAIPLGNIERITAVRSRDIVSMGGGDAVLYEGRTLPLARLSAILDLPHAENSDQDAESPVVILAAAERRMAFLVDALTGEQEIVIKGLGKQLSRVGGIAGATVMGDGSIVLILNVADLIKMALRAQPHSTVDRKDSWIETPSTGTLHAQPRILVVDDSITTRTLEKNILEAAGYLVSVATDGQEAWEIISTGNVPDLVVSDVSMPRLDGIALTMRIRADARTAQIPVILVTALDSPRDKSRGIDAGADAYITKGAFDQSNLLSTIGQLI